MADFYIGPSGSDANPGTEASPWAITALSTHAADIAENTVWLLDGTYRLTGGNDDYVMSIPSTASGTSGALTTVQAVNPYKAIITTDAGGGVYPQGADRAIATIQLDSSFITFKNIKMGPTGGHGFAILDAHDILIDSCWLADMYAKRNLNCTDDNMGAVFFRNQVIAKQNVIVRNCLIEDIYALSLNISMNDSNGVGDCFGIDGLLVEHCTFRNMGVPMFLKGRSTNVVFRYNAIFNCSGFTMAFMTMNTGLGPSTNEVYGNLFVGNWCFGANSANTQGDACTIANFYGNTIIMDEIEGGNACDFGYMVMMGGATAQSLNFYNNAIYLNPAFALGPGMIRFPIDTEALATRIDTWNNNRYAGQFNIEDNVGAASYNTIGDWQATGRDTNGSFGDLGLVDQTGDVPDDYRPDVGSALIGAGIGGIDIGWTGLTAYVGHSWGTPMLDLTCAIEATPVDLTEFGTEDWADWNDNPAELTAGEWKLDGGQTISAALYGDPDPGVQARDGTNARTISWTDGTNNATGSNTTLMYNAGFVVGQGFEVTFPADTTARTAYLFIGYYSSNLQITAIISDGSSANQVNDTTFIGADSTAFNGTVQVDYAANAPGQTLTIRVETLTSLGGSRNCGIQAAALALGGAGGATVVMARDGRRRGRVLPLWGRG